MDATGIGAVGLIHFVAETTCGVLPTGQPEGGW